MRTILVSPAANGVVVSRFELHMSNQYPDYEKRIIIERSGKTDAEYRLAIGEAYMRLQEPD